MDVYYGFEWALERCTAGVTVGLGGEHYYCVFSI